MRILYVASEAVPFAKTGGLADVMGALPKYVKQHGHEAVVIIPKYRAVKAQAASILSLTIPMGAGLRFCTIRDPETLTEARFFLVDYPDYFDREDLYRTLNQDYPDNAERFAFFSLAALEFAKRASQAPDIIHCNDWQSALVPVYLKTLYQDDPFFRKTKTLLTIHNLAFQGVFPRTVLSRISLPESLFNAEQMEFYGNLNFLKGGILFADKISTVSQKYSEEIRTKEFGCGLEGVLLKRAKDLCGILNGVDYSQWDPLTDPWLVSNYSANSLEGKKACKVDLLKEFQIHDSLARPLIGIVSRLADQKGFDLLREVGDAIVQEGASLVVLGTGEEKYCRFFVELQRKYPLYVGAKIMYDERLAHKIEGGADMFLMPSRFEPCGLNQIYSLKYGTVPVVRATGGLDDTIVDYAESLKGNGFKFTNYLAEELLLTVRRALQVFRNPDSWKALMKNCMGLDFSWHRSAQRYSELYQSMRSNDSVPNQRVDLKTATKGRLW
ncbi:MAG: glycogen synthase GlgA [Acidobacteria bacterium]|nr:MAG: glycogen synthase GlgA [Acidobacteriota bacterium]